MREQRKTGNTFNNVTRATRVELKIAKLQDEIETTDGEIVKRLREFREQKAALDALDHTIDQLRSDNEERQNELEDLKNPDRPRRAARKSEPHICMMW